MFYYIKEDADIVWGDLVLMVFGVSVPFKVRKYVATFMNFQANYNSIFYPSCKTENHRMKRKGPYLKHGPQFKRHDNNEIYL